MIQKKHRNTLRKFTLIMFSFFFISGVGFSQYTITVSAGNIERNQSIVEFSFPVHIEKGEYWIKDETGRKIILQINEEGKAIFLLNRLAAGASKNFAFDSERAETGNSSKISFEINEGKGIFSKKGKPLLAFFHETNQPEVPLDERYKRAGYIHPIYSPNGIPLTNHLDTLMHPHHFGIWTAWTKTSFQGRNPDFWNQQSETGFVRHLSQKDLFFDGPVVAGFESYNEYVDITNEKEIVALNEQWQGKVWNHSSKYNVLDLEITHSVNTANPLILPEYHYGGLAFRGHQQWDDPENVSFLTSKGFTRENANESRARWVRFEGMIDGKKAGIAILSHPANFRAPQPIRIHPETPYVVFAPMQLGEFQILPGAPYIMNNRFIAYDNSIDAKTIDHLWYDYAYPVGVTVKVEKR